MIYLRRLALGIVLCSLLSAAGPQPADAMTFAQRLESYFLSAGGQGSGLAVDLKSGKTIWSHQPDTARLPASVNKLYTTAAALLDLGPNRRLTTTVFTAAGNGRSARSGTLKGNLYLRGGGDPTLTGRDLAALAKAVRSTGLRTVSGLVVGDEGFMDRIRGVPADGPDIDPSVGAPMGGLVFDRGKLAHSTASRFTRELRRAGVWVGKGRTTTASAPIKGDILAVHRSTTLATLVNRINTPSDAYYAEMLTKVHGAIILHRGTTAAGLKAAASALAKIGVRARRADGSGISRANWTTPRMLVRLISRMMSNQAFTSSLPIAGRTGTLSERMTSGPAAGRCRGKTGTLSNASAIAGYCTTTRGDLVAFAVLNNSTMPWDARPSQDAIVQSLASWRRSSG